MTEETQNFKTNIWKKFLANNGCLYVENLNTI